jgi:RNA polymerase sigma factor (sigma-70 family)
MKKKFLKTTKFIDAYNEYYSYIAGLIYRKIKNYDDAEEICQEVFTFYYDQFEKIKTPKSWLAKVAHYKILEFFRKNSSDTQNSDLNDDLIAEVISDESLNLLLEEILSDQQNIKSEEEKSILTQHVFEKSTYKEIAESLGLTSRQVKYKLEKIKHRLLQSFKEIGIQRIEDLL